MNRRTPAAARKAAPRRRPYDATSRRAEAERTAARIVDAATGMVKAGVRPEEISYADLAARAGVATRTVYRHFPEIDALVVAVAAATLDRLTAGGIAQDLPAVAAQLARFHEILCADPKLFRVLIDTPLRGAMNYGGFLKRVFGDVLERIPAQHRDATAATIEMLANPYAWEVMHSYWGMPREQITRTCLAAIQAITDRFQREPELLDATAPLPPLFRSANQRRDETNERSLEA
jgi:AcrR family transcriptional regulator